MPESAYLIQPPGSPAPTYPSVEGVARALLDHGAIRPVEVMDNRGVRRDLTTSELGAVLGTPPLPPASGRRKVSDSNLTRLVRSLNIV
jgi:hypothetical protein